MNDYAINDYDSIINDFLEKNIETNYPEVLYESMAYSVKAGGKRMRPKLMLYTAEGFGGDISQCLPFACALEYIHTYSLIHDDLPCMDNDDLRRGVPTNHKVYGEAIALIAGDGLLNLAYEIMVRECVKNPLLKNIRAMEEIALSAGCSGMVGGQAADILSEGKDISTYTLHFIQENKTAAIIRSAFSCGAVLSEARQSEINEIKEAAALFGKAFQIKDDLLDVLSTTEVLGKPVGSDDKNSKATHVSLFGIEQAQKDFNELSLRALGIIEGLNLKTDGLLNYIRLLMGRER